MKRPLKETGGPRIQQIPRVKRGKARHAPESETRHVLLVEDSADSREAMTAFLHEEGYQVVAVVNGIEAMNHLRWGKPVCVILDMRMPLMTGWEVRTAMKEEPELQGVPVIGITGGRWKPQDEAEFIALLSKPLDYGELRAALKRCDSLGDGR